MSPTAILRVIEGEPLSAAYRLIRVLQTIDEPWGGGTASRRVYVVEAEVLKQAASNGEAPQADGERGA